MMYKGWWSKRCEGRRREGKEPHQEWSRFMVRRKMPAKRLKTVFSTRRSFTVL